MTQSGRLNDRVAIVSGGASGIGRATVLALADEGARVAILDRDADQAAAVAAEATSRGPDSTAYPVDLQVGDGLSTVIDLIARDFGRIDILVNSAGISGDYQTTLDAAPSNFDAVFGVNVKAMLLLIQAAARHMIDQGRGGRIVNLSSSAAFRGGGAPILYAASKGAVNGLTRVAAADLGQYDINVNAVAPGMTKTPMTAGVGDDDAYRRIVSSGPLENLLQRPSEAEDVAAAVLFLCLPSSRQITGQVIHTSAGQVV